MPLYEYRCSACGAAFTELLLRADPEAMASVSCPKCGSRQVVKQVSAAAASVKSVGAAAASCAPGG